MITYLDKSNAQKYHILFDKATKLLKSAAPSELEQSFPANFTWDNFKIGSLNEYFGYLDHILLAAAGGNSQNLNTDQTRFYLRLPLDEDILEINADTREITVPRAFANQGIGVQGDELAETLYFTIDRFFDHKDLANNEMQIAIQWEITQNGETVQGISRNFGKDIESIPGKIIFGWNIGSELTQDSGTIRFAVRFYEVNSTTHKFVYSLTTLPAMVVIQPTLNFDVINEVIIDRSNDVTSNIHTSGIYDVGIPLPAEPIITSELKVVSPTPNVNAPRIIDLDSNNEVKLSIGAQPGDNGIITYEWKSRLYNSTQQDYEQSWIFNDTINNNAVEDYQEITTTLNPDFIYYIKDIDSNPATYSLLNFDLLEEPYEYSSVVVGYDDEENEIYNYGYKKAGTEADVIQVYEKVNIATVTAAGKYTVDINARTLVNTTPKHLDDSLTITVPAPRAPIITIPDNYNVTGEGNNQEIHFVFENTNDTIKLVPESILGEAAEGLTEAEVGDYQNKVTSSYQWQKRSGESSWNDITETVDDIVTVKSDFDSFIDFDTSNNQLTINSLSSEETIDDYYRFIVTSVRNGVSKDSISAPYRITNAPKKPVLGFIDGSNFNEQNYQSSNSGKTQNFINGKVYSIDINASADIPWEKLTYIWVKSNIELEDEKSNIVDLPNTINGSTAIEGYEIADIKAALLKNEADSENPVNFNPYNGNDTIVASGQVDTSVLMNGRAYQAGFTCTNTGNYYCIIINEVNNHIAVNVSPYIAIVN